MPPPQKARADVAKLKDAYRCLLPTRRLVVEEARSDDVTAPGEHRLHVQVAHRLGQAANVQVGALNVFAARPR